MSHRGSGTVAPPGSAAVGALAYSQCAPATRPAPPRPPRPAAAPGSQVPSTDPNPGDLLIPRPLPPQGGCGKQLGGAQEVGGRGGGSFYRPFLPCHSLVRATPHPQETLPRIWSSESLLRHSGLFPESDMGVPRAPSKGTDSLVCPAVLAEPWHFLSQLRGQSSLFPVSHCFLLQNRVTALGRS